MRLISLVILLVLTTMATVAEAQAYWNPSSGSFPLSTQAAYYGWTAHQRKEAQAILDRLEGKKAGVATSPRPAPAIQHRPASATDFKPSPDRPAVAAYFAAQQLPPAQQQLLRDLFDLTFKQVATHLRKDNVASAIGFAMLTAVCVSRGIEIEDEEVAETIARLNDALAGDATFRKMTSAERQEVHDRMIMTGALLLYMQSVGTRDRRAADQARQVAGEIVAQLSGITRPE